ncbi:hypothetical protein DNU06_05845 [Putridiphycobacter roseus]|uniref:Uracil-DNA glycosylase-like domain-containing protein n=1 Tax=Putridiphycobacter roseus TaxID=2219161 RepID=A0A2W1NTS4_9FLAO|nr:hypothetical protein [Putridiphycobacter roseus]PZE18138.1 hypothetical protein DNU06_05845 [Putridiphycobacter roseus]
MPKLSSPPPPVLENMQASELVEQYQKIWDKYSTTPINGPTKVEDTPLLNRGFEFQFDAEINNPDVLFIGINPSFQPDRPQVRQAYAKPKNGPGYFRPFYKIEEDLKASYQREITWTQLDLLVLRETQQPYIENHLLKAKRGQDFILEQLAVANEIITALKPKVIVVSNTLARELMSGNSKQLVDGREVGVWMDYKYEFDQTLGTEKMVQAGALNGTPVFFTAMLSGQKSIDRGTFQRLVWHIDAVLGKGE